jgi:hypothetical protein
LSLLKIFVGKQQEDRGCRLDHDKKKILDVPELYLPEHKPNIVHIFRTALALLPILPHVDLNLRDRRSSLIIAESSRILNLVRKLEFKIREIAMVSISGETA